MAGSSNTTWLKGFSENPYGLARGNVGLAELVRQVGGEWLVYPPGNEAGLTLSRQEALARTLWTRGVIDGDMTAIKLLVELLEGKGTGSGEDAAVLTADQWAAAEAAFKAWSAERGVAEHGGAAHEVAEQAPDEASEVSGNER